MKRKYELPLSTLTVLTEDNKSLCDTCHFGVRAKHGEFRYKCVEYYDRFQMGLQDGLRTKAYHAEREAVDQKYTSVIEEQQELQIIKRQYRNIKSEVNNKCLFKLTRVENN